MSRRAFTLIELLVIIAIIGAMVAVSVLSVQAGQEAARLRGAVRDVFATIRQARSIALVTQRPCVITFATHPKDGEAVGSVEINSAELLAKNSLMSMSGKPPRSIDGYKTYGETEDSENASRLPPADANATSDSDGGHTVEEVLFKPIDKEVLRGICIKVVMADEEQPDGFGGEVNEAKKSMISTFSNVDVLLGKFKAQKEKEKEEVQNADSVTEEKPQAASADASADIPDEEKSVVWQTNGRTDAHSIYIYCEGAKFPDDAWEIKVDMFGAAKVVTDGEDE